MRLERVKIRVHEAILEKEDAAEAGADEVGIECSTAPTRLAKMDFHNENLLHFKDLRKRAHSVGLPETLKILMSIIELVKQKVFLNTTRQNKNLWTQEFMYTQLMKLETMISLMVIMLLQVN